MGGNKKSPPEDPAGFGRQRPRLLVTEARDQGQQEHALWAIQQVIFHVGLFAVVQLSRAVEVQQPPDPMAIFIHGSPRFPASVRPSPLEGWAGKHWATSPRSLSGGRAPQSFWRRIGRVPKTSGFRDIAGKRVAQPFPFISTFNFLLGPFERSQGDRFN